MTQDPNFEFMARLGKGEAGFRIMLSKKDQGPAPVQEELPQQVKRGLTQLRPQDDLMGKRKKHFIEFYDLGQVWNGSAWANLDFNVEPGVDVSSPGSPVFSDFGLTEWTALADLILTVPFADWPTYYRQITDTRWGLAAYNGTGPGILASSTTIEPQTLMGASNPRWTSPKLKPVGTNLEVQTAGGLGVHFNSSEGTNYKFTTVYDYTASPVTPDFSRGAKVYLMPDPMFCWAEQQTGSGASYVDAYLWGHWTVLPRTLLLDKTLRRTNDSPYEEIPIFQGYYLTAASPSGVYGYQSVGAWMDDQHHIGTAFAGDIVAWLKSLPLATLYVRHGAGGPVTWGYEALSNYPYTITTETQAFWFFYYSTWDFVTGFRYDGPGILKAVVEIGGVFYYCWGKTSVSLSYWDGLGMMTTPI